MAETKSHQGSCLCGSVRYRVEGALRDVVACHCEQCRKQTGHFYATTSAPQAALSIEDNQSLTWYRSSPGYRRGFCGKCGSALFWKDEASEEISILAGSLDGPTQLKIAKHIFCASKGDYYDIHDQVPLLERS